MTKLKNILTILISLIVLVALFLNFDAISEKLVSIFNSTPEVKVLPSNEYKKNDEFKLIKQVDEYIPYNYQDLLNIFYSTLNQGWTDFTFYCPVEYDNCLNDVAKISLNEELLSNINNYVHPYNSYTSIKTLYDSTGKVNILVKHLYSENEIKYIEKYADSVMSSTLKDNMSLETKIKTLHDYIINNTKYDAVRASEGDSKYDSARMTGLINEHYAICSGYADIMGVFLTKLGLSNFKVSSDSHVWNAVYLKDRWLHLDLTWDDPISTNGKDVLQHDYFLISTNRLKVLAKDNKDHNFDSKVYKEFAN